MRSLAALGLAIALAAACHPRPAARDAPAPVRVDEEIVVEPSPAPVVEWFSAPLYDPPDPDPAALPAQARACVAGWLTARRGQQVLPAPGEADDAYQARARDALASARAARRAHAAACLPVLAAATLDARGAFVHAVMRVIHAIDVDAGQVADAAGGDAHRAAAIAAAARCEADGDDAALHALCARLAGDLLLERGDAAAGEAALRRAIPGLPSIAADQVRLQLALRAGERTPDDAFALLAELTDPKLASVAATLGAQLGWRVGDCDAAWRAAARCRASGEACAPSPERAWFQAACLADPAAGADRSARLPALDPGADVDPTLVARLARAYAAPDEPVARLRWAAGTCARDRAARAALPITLDVAGTTGAPALTPTAPSPDAARVAACAVARHASVPAPDGAPLSGRLVLVR